jgi:uncharacterized protein (TIRG00374 family)
MRAVHKITLTAVKLCLVGALTFFALRHVDLLAAWRSARAIPLNVALGVLALFLFQYLLSAARLARLLSLFGSRMSLWAAFEIALVGAFFSQTFISFIGGDVVRVWRITRYRISLGLATKSVFLDRLSGLAGSIAIIALTIPFIPHLASDIDVGLWGAFIASLPLAGIAGALLLRRLPSVVRRTRAVAFVLELVDSGFEIASKGWSAVPVLVLSIAIQLLSVLILYLLALAIGIDITLWNCTVLMPSVLFLSMLPISVAGWGVREGAMIAALSLIKIPAHQSLALSVSFGLGLVVVSLPGGLIWLLVRPRRTGSAADVVAGGNVG